MLQLHLSYQQFYCLLRCDLYKRFYGNVFTPTVYEPIIENWIVYWTSFTVYIVHSPIAYELLIENSHEKILGRGVYWSLVYSSLFTGFTVSTYYIFPWSMPGAAVNPFVCNGIYVAEGMQQGKSLWASHGKPSWHQGNHFTNTLSAHDHIHMFENKMQ